MLVHLLQSAMHMAICSISWALMCWYVLLTRGLIGVDACCLDGSFDLF
jgi:hypothetical protein